MKIFIADDHQLFLEGIKSVLQSMGNHVDITSVNNGQDALKTLTDNIFDIALIDLRLPNIDGFSLLTELSKINCLTPVIMVTASEDPEDANRAFDLGAMGFVSKSANSQKIIQSIESVIRGEVVKPQTHNHKSNDSHWADQHHITLRQLEVLRLIKQGLSNQAIADRLFLSTSTVKTHIVALFQAFETQSRTETILKAQQLGLD